VELALSFLSLSPDPWIQFRTAEAFSVLSATPASHPLMLRHSGVRLLLKFIVFGQDPVIRRNALATLTFMLLHSPFSDDARLRQIEVGKSGISVALSSSIAGSNCSMDNPRIYFQALEGLAVLAVALSREHAASAGGLVGGATKSSSALTLMMTSAHGHRGGTNRSSANSTLGTSTMGVSALDAASTVSGLGDDVVGAKPRTLATTPLATSSRLLVFEVVFMFTVFIVRIGNM
jgi:hypothetical protein